MGLVLGQLAWADPAAIDEAKDEAQALREQIDELADRLSAAVEDYNYAVAMLGETQAAAERTQTLLTRAEADLEEADALLVERLVAIYKEGQHSFLETLLGSASFSEVVNQLDWMERLSGQDAQLIDDVQAYTDEKSTRAAELERQLADQQVYAAQADTARLEVERRLAANEEALADKQDEIAQLVKEEEERQRRLLEEARKAQEEAARKAAALAAIQQAQRTTTTKKPATATTGQTVKPASTTTTKQPTTPTGEQPTTSTSEASSSPTSTTTTTTAPAPDPVPVDAPRDATPEAVVSIALQYLGRPYVWAASGPNSFDCSGFVMYVYKKVGVRLPHSSRMQAGYGTAVSRENLRPADLIFFYSPIHHVAIYIGDGKMVHAAGVGKGVRIDEVWTRNYNCARRIL